MKVPHRMLVVDRHESYKPADFKAFCKDNNIMTIILPPHSSQLILLLEFGCFGSLKRAYSKEIENFKSYITHITMTEFFIASHATHTSMMKKKKNLNRYFKEFF